MKVITISREYGSGGRLIGRMVAEKLGFDFYDKELIAIVAEESGLSKEFIEQSGEHSSAGSRLFDYASTGMYRQSAFVDSGLSFADRIHIHQSNVIQQIAEKGRCVIIGRSADYILRERTDCLHVFIYADIAHKRARAIEYFGIAPDEVDKELAKKDKTRASHYRHYTDQVWGMARNYHLSIDSGLLGLEHCRDTIIDIFQRCNANETRNANERPD